MFRRHSGGGLPFSLIIMTPFLNDSLADIKSHIGMIVQSTTLDTEAKVKAIYGGSKWTMISGRFLLGAAAGEAGQTGGAEKHNHVMPMGFDPNFIYCHCGTDGLPALGSETTTGFRITANMSNGITSGEIRDGITGQASNLPPYKKVYIWERTA